jgi:hypothetical protein
MSGDYKTDVNWRVETLQRLDDTTDVVEHIKTELTGINNLHDEIMSEILKSFNTNRQKRESTWRGNWQVF